MIVGTIWEVMTGSRAIPTSLWMNLVDLILIVQGLLWVDLVLILILAMMSYVGLDQGSRGSIARGETAEIVTAIMIEIGIVVEVVIDENIVPL